ncbi:hypothetical protein ABH930_000620 [Kitasatospora sp. GAS204A]|nr:hypothetical protein [Kitasatospora sp. GAS204B]
MPELRFDQRVGPQRSRLLPAGFAHAVPVVDRVRVHEEEPEGLVGFETRPTA